MDESVADHFDRIAALAGEILARLQQEVNRLGFAPAEVTLSPAEQAVYRLEKDPYIGRYSLVGDWIETGGGKRGSLLFHADGSFFVEQDVVRAHPTRPGWFVEAVNAWGREADIRVEARLLPVPE